MLQLEELWDELPATVVIESGVLGEYIDCEMCICVICVSGGKRKGVHCDIG